MPVQRLIRVYDDGYRLALDTGRRRKKGREALVIPVNCRRRWLPARDVDKAEELDAKRLPAFIAGCRRYWRGTIKGGGSLGWPKELGRRPPRPSPANRGPVLNEPKRSPERVIWRGGGRRSE